MGAMESLRWMEARLPEILKDLEAFVRRESPSGDLEGLEAAARFLSSSSPSLSPPSSPLRRPSSLGRPQRIRWRSSGNASAPAAPSWT